MMYALTIYHSTLLQDKVKKSRNKGEKQGLREDIRHLRRELVQREKAEILKRADVVLVTLTSASNDGPLKVLDKDHFDMAVIDECSQVGVMFYSNID